MEAIRGLEEERSMADGFPSGDADQNPVMARISWIVPASSGPGHAGDERCVMRCMPLSRRLASQSKSFLDPFERNHASYPKIFGLPGGFRWLSGGLLFRVLQPGGDAREWQKNVQEGVKARIFSRIEELKAESDLLQAQITRENADDDE